MTENERYEVNHLTAVQGEMPCKIGGREARHLTLETISVLDMAGSPVAAPIRAALNGVAMGEAAAAPEVHPHDLAVLAWAFCAPEDTVLGVALRCSAEYTAPAVEAALRYTRGWSLSEIGDVMPHVAREVKALQAAFFESGAPEHGERGSKKNSTGNAGCR